MKELKLFTTGGKEFNYIIDDQLSIGIYSTTTIEYLIKNDVTQYSNYTKSNRISDEVLVRTLAKDNSRIDFLITEDICFESLELISLYGFNGQFFDDFAKAFNRLDTTQWEDSILYY